MNRNTLSKLAIFMGGAIIGSVVTWKLVEAKYKQIAEEEIESVREVYAKVYADSDDEESEEPDEEEETVEDDAVENEEDEEMSEPYVIEYDDYDENGYATETLYYFDDGVLTDSISGNVIEDINGTVGEDSIKQLLDSGEDYIYVRNDWLEIDYEILRDRRNYSEVE